MQLLFRKITRFGTYLISPSITCQNLFFKSHAPGELSHDSLRTGEFFKFVYAPKKKKL